MKNIYLPLLVAFIIAAASCSKNDDFVKQTDNAGRIIDITASIAEGNGVQSKVSVTQEDNLWVLQWNKGDMLGAWSSGVTTVSRFKMDSFDSDLGKIATFKGPATGDKIRFISPYSQEYFLFDKYPIDVSRRYCDIAAATYNISDQCYMVSDEMTLSGSTAYVNFHNINAGIKLRLKFSNIPESNVRLLKVELSGSGSTEFYPTATFDLTDNDFDSALSVGDAGTVSIVVNDPPVVTADTIYTLPLMIIPTTFYAGTDNSVKIKVYLSGYSKEFTISTTEDARLESGKYYTFSKLCDMSDADHTQSWTGEGTANDPYLILTASDLTAIATAVNGGNGMSGKYLYLMNDIDLNGSEDNQWTVIGNSSNYFRGTFEGANHKISGLYVKATDSFKGLFGYVSGSISNLSVNGYVKGSGNVGGVCGYNSGTIMNCSYSGSVSGDSYSGGICGSNSGTLINSYNTASVSGTYVLGGICGDNSRTIINCYNTGSVNGSSHAVGGVIGYSGSNSGRTTNCFNTGSINGSYDVGGVCGSIGNGSIASCYYLSGCASSESENGAEKSAEEFLTLADTLNKISSQFNEAYSRIIAYGWANGDKSPYLVYGSDPDDIVLSHNGNWTDAASPNFGGGLGTVQNPYMITNAYELAHLAVIVNNGNNLSGKFFRIMHNIDLSGNKWVPIGQEDEDDDTKSTQFNGIVDGAGHEITGLYIDPDISTNCKGLFGRLGEGSVISNLTVTGSVHGWSYIGGICGYAYKAIINNCNFTGSVDGAGYLGGICGSFSDGTMDNCSFDGNITCSHTINYYGGVCGSCTNSTVSYCDNKGSIISSGSSVGGVFGSCSNCTVAYCNNTATVQGAGNSSFFIGGVCGNMSGGGSMAYCYNTGEIRTYGSTIGGIAGTNSCSVINCYNTGTVVCDMGNVTGVAGGVIGNNSGNVINCYNTGIVGSYHQTAGGVVGEQSGYIENCYNTGSVSSQRYVGGVCGYDASNATKTVLCYYLSGCAKTQAYTHNGIGNYYYSPIPDIEGKTDAKSAEDFTQLAITLNTNAASYNGSDPTPQIKASKWTDGSASPYLLFGQVPY